MKKFIHEFKEFALKGNVMNLAVGVIIGAAFQSIVTALTSSFINPHQWRRRYCWWYIYNKRSCV